MSGCHLATFFDTQIPQGCDFVIWQSAALSTAAPHVYVKRDNTLIDVTGAIESTATTLGVQYPEIDCHENVISVETRDEAYTMHRVEIVGANEGEQLWFSETTPFGNVTATRQCDEVTPQPVCGHLAPRCETGPGADDNSGCNAGGTSGGAIVFSALALALVIRARR